MPGKYDEPARAKAVLLVTEHRGDYANEWRRRLSASSTLR
jgi:transposase